MMYKAENLPTCCHDLKSDNCTIKILPRRFMVHPDKIHGVCSECGRKFTFSASELPGANGAGKEVKDENK